MKSQRASSRRRQTFENLETVLVGRAGSLRKALKVTVYLANIADWAVMNAIYEESIDLRFAELALSCAGDARSGGGSQRACAAGGTPLVRR